MAEKICASCSTENPSHFEYCKHCGAFLPVVDKICREKFPPAKKPTFDELSYNEYRSYIGRGADSILYDFHTMEQTSKVVFSLPVLFLGIFFGFFGMSAWFFSRKLKKQGFILLMIGIILVFAEAVMNSSLNKSLVDAFISLADSNLDAASMSQNLSQLLSYYSYSLVSISKYISFVASFFISAFALRSLKRESYKKALAIKQKCEEDPRLPLELLLKLRGGTSIGLAFIPIIIGLFAPTFSFLVSII